jgi:RNA polymerase sigma-70 factor (ECF subfamily)
VENLNIHIHESLIEECRNGDRNAQFRLYNQYSKAMYNLAYRMMNNREEAEDMLQEAFVDCFRNISSFRFESTFGAWLKKIVVNKCLNQIQRKKIDLQLCENLPTVADDEPEEVYYDSSMIVRGIEKLPDGYRVILTLYLLEGYDHSEISQILKISESTSKSQYSRAKERLRNILKEEIR